MIIIEGIEVANIIGEVIITGEVIVTGAVIIIEEVKNNIKQDTNMSNKCNKIRWDKHPNRMTILTIKNKEITRGAESEEVAWEVAEE